MKFRELLLVGIVSVVLSSLALAQDKKPDEQFLPTEIQNKIMKLQLQQSDLAAEWTKIQQEAKDIPGQFNSLNQQIDALEKEGLKELKLDPAKSDVDPKTFKVTVKPKSAPLLAAPPEKK